MRGIATGELVMYLAIIITASVILVAVYTITDVQQVLTREASSSYKAKEIGAIIDSLGGTVADAEMVYTFDKGYKSLKVKDRFVYFEVRTGEIGVSSFSYDCVNDAEIESSKEIVIRKDQGCIFLEELTSCKSGSDCQGSGNEYCWGSENGIFFCMKRCAGHGRYAPSSDQCCEGLEFEDGLCFDLNEGMPPENGGGDEPIEGCLTTPGPNEDILCDLGYRKNRNVIDICEPDPPILTKVKELIFDDAGLKEQVERGYYDNSVRKIWQYVYNDLYERGKNYCFPACADKTSSAFVDRTIECGMCNHWAAVLLSLIRTVGVPPERTYNWDFCIAGRGCHAVMAYKSDSGGWWVLDTTCCRALVPLESWHSTCSGCDCSLCREAYLNDYEITTWSGRETFEGACMNVGRCNV